MRLVFSIEKNSLPMRIKELQQVQSYLPNNIWMQDFNKE